MQSLPTLLFINEIIPFCSVADTLAVCSVVRRLTPASVRLQAFYLAMRGECPPTWDLDEYVADPLCKDEDESATEGSRLMRLYRAIKTFRALEPTPGAWALPSWCPYPRRPVDIALDIVYYAFGVAIDDAEPFEGRGPLAFTAETAANIVNCALSCATGDEVYPRDIVNRLRLLYDPTICFTRECQKATFAWIAALPGRLHELLPPGDDLDEDPVTVVTYMVWTHYLEHVIAHQYSWSIDTLEGLEFHLDFLDEALRCLYTTDVHVRDVSAIKNDILQLRDDVTDLIDTLDTRYWEDYTVLGGIADLFAANA